MQGNWSSDRESNEGAKRDDHEDIIIDARVVEEDHPQIEEQDTRSID
jgi:hypothetical protein